MKKVMATMLAAATAATMLSGCGSSNSGSTETKAAETTAAAESGAKAEETTAADAAADGEKKEIYLLIRARGDLSYWDSMADGADRAAVDFADQANVHVIETTADNQANLTAMYEAADKGADMIITAGDFIDNMVTVAEEYPEISFLMVNEKMECYDNVHAIDFSTSQAGFLAGIAAADVASQGLEGTSGNKTVGFIGGMDEVTVIEEFFIGYIQGVKYCGNFRILGFFCFCFAIFDFYRWLPYFFCHLLLFCMQFSPTEHSGYHENQQQQNRKSTSSKQPFYIFHYSPPYNSSHSSNANRGVCHVSS